MFLCKRTYESLSSLLILNKEEISIVPLRRQFCRCRNKILIWLNILYLFRLLMLLSLLCSFKRELTLRVVYCYVCF